MDTLRIPERYIPIRLLGKGGLGKVYLAHDPFLERLVAIKVLNDTGPESSRFLLREARATARCRHRNIVVVYEVSDDPSSPHMVLEYIHGATLRAKLLDEPQGLNKTDIHNIAFQVADALSYAHSTELIHHDLKPENIMVGSQDLKVLDFGLSIRSADPPKGGIGGTLAYLAPEQLRGEQVGKQVDVWAFGLILYECIRGQHLRDHIGETRYLMALTRGEPLRLDGIKGSLFEPVIAGCLEPEPWRRIEDGTQLLLRIQATLYQKSKLHALPETLGQGRGGVGVHERRQLTMLLVGLYNADALLASKGDEYVAEYLEVLQTLLAESGGKSGGVVATGLPEGAGVYYGLDNSHEGDVIKAITAGLSLLNHPLLQDVQLRAIVHNGSMIVRRGTVTASGLMGMLPSLTLRDLQHGPPGGLILTEAARAMARDVFLWSALDSPNAGQNPLFLVSGASVQGSKPVLPLYGRQVPFKALRAVLSGDVAGRRVIVTGPPGIGKSRLLHEAIRDIAAEQNLWLVCQPQQQSTAFAPIKAMLHQLAGRESLRRRFETLTLGPNSELLIEAAGLPPKERVSRTWRGWSSQRKRRAFFNALTDWVKAENAKGLRAIIIEDLHWADPSTLEWVQHLFIESEKETPICLMTSRDETQAAALGMAEVCSLKPLSDEVVVALVRHIASGLSEAHAQAIVDLADGVPFFAVELARAAAIEGESTDWKGSVALRALMSTRLESAGIHKHLLQVGAVIGVEFEIELLAFLTTLPMTTLDNFLNTLTQRHFIAPVGASGRYRFTHALLREAALNSLVKKSREAIEYSVAIALENRFTQEAEQAPTAVAEHFSYAGDSQRAIKWWRLAGMSALSQSAHTEAITHFENAIELGKQLAEEEHHSPLQEMVLAELYTTLAVPLSLTQGWAHPSVKSTYEHARQHLSAAEAPERGQSVVQFGEGSIVARLGMSTYHIVRGDFSLARTMSYETLRMAQKNGLDHLGLEARLDVGTTSVYLSEHRIALEAFSEIEAVYESELHGKHALLFGKDPLTVAWVHIAMAKTCLGDVVNAIEIAHRAVTQAERIGHSFSQLWARSGLGITAFIRGDFETAGEQGKVMIQEAESQGYPNWLAQGLIFNGLLRVTKGEVDEGLAQMRQGWQLWGRTGARLGIPGLGAVMVQGLLLAGNHQEARDRLGECQRVMLETEEVWTWSEMMRLKGDLNWELGRLDEAIFHYQAALDHATQREETLLELIAAVRLAEVYHAQEKQGDALELLSQPRLSAPSLAPSPFYERRGLLLQTLKESTRA